MNNPSLESSPENQQSQSKWEKAFQKFPAFDKFRAERAKAESLKNEEREFDTRLAEVNKVLESGNISGHEEEINSLIHDGAKSRFSSKTAGLERFLTASQTGRNPEEHYHQTARGDLGKEIWRNEEKEINAVKKLSTNSKESLRQLAAYNLEQERIQHEEYAAKKAREDAEYEERLNQPHEINTMPPAREQSQEVPIPQNVEQPQKEVDNEEWREKLQEGTSSLPDQGPNPFSPNFGEYPMDPFNNNQ